MIEPGGKPGEPVRCQRCGQEWPQDPCFEVVCPICGAGKGQRCKRPSGHQGPFVGFHSQRELEAMRQGYVTVCPYALVKPVGRLQDSQTPAMAEQMRLELPMDPICDPTVGFV
jgi:hypothetical protein